MARIHPKVPLDWEDLGDTYCIEIRKGSIRMYDRPLNICGARLLGTVQGFARVDDQTIINPRFIRSIKDSQ